MNKFEQQAQEQRRSTLRMSMLLWSIGGVLLVAALALLGFSSSAPQGFWKGAAITVAIFVLILRLAGRRLKSRRSRAVKIDEQSRLHLE
jgi:membrane protein implicated in regulation of membrane protease activity